jgi:hypothetical protein
MRVADPRVDDLRGLGLVVQPQPLQLAQELRFVVGLEPLQVDARAERLVGLDLRLALPSPNHGVEPRAFKPSTKIAGECWSMITLAE